MTSDPATTQPPGSQPGTAAALGIIGALILIAGLIALPFFLFSIVIAAPLAIVILLAAAFFLAARQGKHRPPPDR